VFRQARPGVELFLATKAFAERADGKLGLWASFR
jgi:hypothetical protein